MNSEKRFVIGATTVIDRDTGLEWQREANGPMPWQRAMDYARGLGEGWRIPTISELYSLVYPVRNSPTSDFPEMPDRCFWSSSSFANDDGVAWSVDFDHGFVDLDDKDYVYHVRCVRSGP